MFFCRKTDFFVLFFKLNAFALFQSGLSRRLLVFSLVFSRKI